MMRLTGSEIITEILAQEKVPYVIGISGHGNLALVDAFRRARDRMRLIMPRHEQAAVHIADGYFRAKGSPLAVFTSIGPGATNTAIGLATAYVDSIPVLQFVGETHVHMRGTGVLQEIERQRWSDLPAMFEPVAKRVWRIDNASQVPRAMGQAFNTMLTGRPGPVVLTLPMDVQAQTIDVEPALADSPRRRPHNRINGDAAALDAAAALLIHARRPVIVVGGGVILSGAEAEVRALAEHLGACVVTSMQGKSAFPEDHPLYAWHMGTNATTCGNAMTANADVLIAVGMRFADKATCSYKPGESFSIPPTKLIHIDIDPYEIGKNYPVEVGIVGDAQAVLASLVERVRALTPARDWAAAPYTNEIRARVSAWLASLRPLNESSQTPVTMGRAIAEVRRVLPMNGMVLTSSGNVQAQLYQEMPFSEPRTYISAGGFSTMGWAYPAAMGAKLAAPERPVVAMVGDGDFLMTFQEIATAVQYGIPVVAIVLNNQGWQAIRDLQEIAYGEGAAYGSMFEQEQEPITPHLADAARAFGAHAARVTHPDEIGPALQAALASEAPAVVEIMVDTQRGTSGGQAPGWWDVPVPGYYADRRARYDQEKSEERI
ncbi:MAG: thiamine pyrophosphate-binding protein [Anaerolineae bacterium]|nr:thiamine pyrophosphate-binding protein [Anaerolineae bacterium]